MKFGKPLVTKAGDITAVEIEVTNTDSAAHSAVVDANSYYGEDLVDIASGAVNDLAPDQTKTVTLLVTGEAQGDPRPFIGTVTK